VYRMPPLRGYARGGGARRMLRNALVNGLKPFIDRPFPLQEIGAAFKYYESQEHF
jgi:hypothetical protein